METIGAWGFKWFHGKNGIRHLWWVQLFIHCWKIYLFEIMGVIFSAGPACHTVIGSEQVFKVIGGVKQNFI